MTHVATHGFLHTPWHRGRRPGLRAGLSLPLAAAALAVPGVTLLGPGAKPDLDLGLQIG